MSSRRSPKYKKEEKDENTKPVPTVSGKDWMVWVLDRLPKRYIVPSVLFLITIYVLVYTPQAVKGFNVIWSCSVSAQKYLQRVLWDPSTEQAKKIVAEKIIILRVYAETGDTVNLETDVVYIMRDEFMRKLVLSELKKPKNQKIMEELGNSSNADVRRWLNERGRL